ncbi:MAG: SDR family oxidoreductase [Chloroflexota bacterium]|nr:SDR family oxidoreductase [Chloroflexota bacterium]MDE2910830.1 SDR family oxidoreductase [Chloroflexota bacterium]
MRGNALVTGANRGIGLEVCRQLARKDYRVMLTARDLRKAEAAVNDLGHDRIHPLQLDVTDEASVRRARDAVARQYGVLDVLVNNAGGHYDYWQTALAADHSAVREAAETNLYGPWRVTQALVQLLKQSAQPRIVNVSSGAAALNSLGAGPPAYIASKAALNALTRMLAAELKEDGVLVNAVCPGWVATDPNNPGGRPIPEGAAGIVWAATLPDDGPTGGSFRDEQPLAW